MTLNIAFFFELNEKYVKIGSIDHCLLIINANFIEDLNFVAGEVSLYLVQKPLQAAGLCGVEIFLFQF